MRSRDAGYLILLGPPGVGKGTQAERLATRFGIPHVATGDLFREAQRKGTQLGKTAQFHMSRGELVPDEITLAMVWERLNRPDCQRGALLDGFPRTIEQARRFEEALREKGKSIRKVLYLRASEETLLNRLAGRWVCRSCQKSFNSNLKDLGGLPGCDECDGELYQRPDDDPETVKERLAVYERETAPLVDYYKERSLLAEIDGEGDIESVQEALLRAVAQE